MLSCAATGCSFDIYRIGSEVIALLALSVLGYFGLKRMFPTYGKKFLQAHFSGLDLNKVTKPLLPEAQGVLVGGVYLIIMFVFIPVPFWRHLFNKNDSFFLDHMVTKDMEIIFKSVFIKYLAGLLCICCMVFLGFTDDALNLPWRYKCILPSLASLPLLMVYLADEGSTTIVMPVFLRSLLGRTVDIGVLYYVYMALLTVFCTNAINIYAGINGIEAGQSLVIACSIIIFNLIELRGHLWRVHLFSLYFLIPFVVLCWALYKANRYPASLFVGDTFCYFAGVTFAVVGVLGHFSKTLLLFFIPQIINFLYSTPQLFELIPCPRHRLPRLNPDDGLLHPRKVCFHPKSLNSLIQFLLTTCARLKLVECRAVKAFQPPSPSACPESSGDYVRAESDKGTELEDEEIVEVDNFTLINLVLRLKGPMHEADATRFLLRLQILSSCLAFFIRYPIAWLFYGVSSS